MAVLKPYTFQAGTKARAAEVNANFDTLYTEVNSLDSKIIEYDAKILDLQNTKANINGNYLNRFSVANPVTNYDAVNKQYLSKVTANSVGYISGLGLTKTGDNSITIDSGNCYDSTFTTILTLQNSLEKTNATQSPSSVYYVYIIAKPSGDEDILISTISDQPNLPDGYTLYRRLGSYTTDSNNVIIQVNNEQIGQYSGTSGLFDSNADSITNLVGPNLTSGVNVSSGWKATDNGWLIINGYSDATSWNEVYANGVQIWQNGQSPGDGRAGYLRIVSPVYILKGWVITTAHRAPTIVFYKCN